MNTTWSCRVVTAAAVAIVSLSAPPFAAGQRAESPRLFEPGIAPPRGPQTERVLPRRSRFVRVRVEQLDRTDVDTVLLNLFDDVQLTARRMGLERRRADGFVWHGRVEDPDGTGTATIAVNQGIAAGTVFMAGRTFEIGFAGDGTHEVREIEPTAFPTDDPGVDLIPDALGDAEGGATAASDASSQIDVMVVWTPNARNAAGGASAMQSLVDLSVANANTAYANSGIGTRLRLVYAGEVSFTEATSNITGDLNKLASSSDGTLDQVHTLRDQYGADVVTLMGAGYTSGGACGVGYLMGSPSTSFAPWAFNVVDRSCAAGNLSYAHEVGHNEGLHHDPANASGTPSYSYAYGFQDPGGSFRTVMSYGGAPRVMHFSNPAVTYSGKPTGVANAQDNARALNGSASSVANFRQAVSGGCSYTVSPASLSFGSGGGTQSATVTTTAGCSWSTSDNASWITVGVAGGSGSASVTVTAAANTGAARTGSVSIGGQMISVSQQQAACTYTVAPTTLSFSSSGGTAAVTITTGSWCSWSVANANAWLATSAASGAGPATLNVTASQNNSTARSGSLTVAGQSIAVSQSGATTCTYSVTPAAMVVGANASTQAVDISTGTGCAWTARSNAAWAAVGTASGSGPARVLVNIAGNSGDSRTAALTIGGNGVTIQQNAASCTFAVSPASLSFDAAGGSAIVSVSTGSWCSWSAANSAGWLGLSASGGTGSEMVTVTASTNRSGDRSATLVIAGTPVSVVQAGKVKPGRVKQDRR